METKRFCFDLAAAVDVRQIVLHRRVDFERIIGFSIRRFPLLFFSTVLFVFVIMYAYFVSIGIYIVFFAFIKSTISFAKNEYNKVVRSSVRANGVSH